MRMVLFSVLVPVFAEDILGQQASKMLVADDIKNLIVWGNMSNL